MLLRIGSVFPVICLTIRANLKGVSILNILVYQIINGDLEAKGQFAPKHFERFPLGNAEGTTNLLFWRVSSGGFVLFPATKEKTNKQGFEAEQADKQVGSQFQPEVNGSKRRHNFPYFSQKYQWCSLRRKVKNAPRSLQEKCKENRIFH